MVRYAKPPQREVIHCPHCGVQHIDRNKPEFPYAEKNHSRHLCERADGGCGRFFFTKSNIGVAAAGPAA